MIGGTALFGNFISQPEFTPPPGTYPAVLKSKEALLQAFRDGGLEMDKPAIMTCGSGITACIVSFGLETMGKHDYSVYDGSWTEWATRGGEVWTGED